MIPVVTPHIQTSASRVLIRDPYVDRGTIADRHPVINGQQVYYVVGETVPPPVVIPANGMHFPVIQQPMFPQMPLNPPSISNESYYIRPLVDGPAQVAILPPTQIQQISAHEPPVAPAAKIIADNSHLNAGNFVANELNHMHTPDLPPPAPRLGETNVVKKKRKQTKDPDAPKHPMSPFLYFLAEVRPRYTARYPGSKVGPISKMISKEWKDMTSDQRKVYERRATDDKARYAREMETYLAKKHLANRPIIK